MYGRIACFMVRIRAEINFLISIIKSMNLISVHFSTYLKRLWVSSLCCLQRLFFVPATKTRVAAQMGYDISVWLIYRAGRTYVCTYVRTVARSRDNQNFSHRWVTTFSYQWCSARPRLRRARSSAIKGHPMSLITVYVFSLFAYVTFHESLLTQR